MIIVSQDKTKIVNFDNLTQIYITRDEEETTTFIRYETVDSLYDDLGEYKAEERAKEVLQEIIAVHQASKMFMATKGVLIQEEMCKAMIEQRKSIFKYEMPKE